MMKNKRTPAPKRVFDISELFAQQPQRYPELKGKVALVTGSSRGIGLAIAVRFAKEGMKVIINSRTPETVQAVVDELTALDVEAIGIPADLSTKEGINALLTGSFGAFGSVDVLVNNAADLKRYPLFDIPDEVFDSQLQSNIAAPYYLSKGVASQLCDFGKPGCIINISSIGSLRSHWPGLPYDATKAALNMITMNMALDLAKYRIRVNAIAPGAIRTYEILKDREENWRTMQNRIPLLRAGEPTEIAAVAAFLASDEASYITGAVLPVDGGVLAQLFPKDAPI
ncbi:MAG: glucose 1-dehydrogenase [Anaerolineae bacterium]|jgi:NAD(P)-dependent dehydrogenase (short-subunit alcohol dehydrogenase family)|nr:glucose 1-dehydrogenase [Anaerolineae bacterium]